MSHRSKSKPSKPKPKPPVRWELEVTPLAGAAGLLAGFIAEIVWKGNMIWMTAGGILGGLAGSVCDTALFFYRRHRRRTEVAKVATDHTAR